MTHRDHNNRDFLLSIVGEVKLSIIAAADECAAIDGAGLTHWTESVKSGL